MPRCSDCTSRCSCIIIEGANVNVTGTGRPDDPYIVSAEGGGEGSTFPPGSIIEYGGLVPPTGWLACNGAAVSRSTYAALYAVLGETYGPGDGISTFNLPDRAGRFGMGADLTYPAGSVGGQASHTLAVANLPAHTHSIAQHAHSMTHDHANTNTTANGGFSDHKHEVKQSDVDGTNNNTFRRGGAQARTVDTSDNGGKGDHVHAVDIPTFTGNTSTGGPTATGSVGSGTAFTNMPPYVAVPVIIKT